MRRDPVPTTLYEPETTLMHLEVEANGSEERVQLCDGLEAGESGRNDIMTGDINDVDCPVCLDTVVEVFPDEMQQARQTLSNHPKVIEIAKQKIQQRAGGMG